MDVTNYNEETRSFWKRALSSTKFEKNGLWGLKSSDGDIVLNPIFDQIEFCSDFIYVHYEHRHTFFYKDGGTTDCSDRDDDFRFYENGLIGLKKRDGTIFLPPIYDESIDWGEDSDVVYVRRGEEFHYYNHQHEEILTVVEDIPEDRYPLCPYNLGEDQNREVLLCVEPIEKKEGATDCYAYNQWVRLARIPCSKVKEIFSNCKLVDMSSDAIVHFEDKDTYIYSARVCTSSDALPITACIKKFQSLGCYESSWEYLLKVSINRKTNINPHDLYNVIKHFEDIGGSSGYNISIDYDDSLKINEVKVFQIHYFWDDMGEFLYDTFKQNILPDGSVEEIIEILDEQSPIKRRKLIKEAYWWIGYSEARSWEETEKVLEYLKSQGANDYTTIILRNLAINPYYMDEVTPEVWNFKIKIITWALGNGGQLNMIHKGKTLYDDFIEDLEYAKETKNEVPEFYESISNAEKFAEWIKNKGAITAEEQRKKIEVRLKGLSPKEVLEMVKNI